MQFSAIRTRCAVRFADPSNAIITDTTWKDYVNARYRRVIGAYPYWPFLESKTTSLTISAESRSVALPSDTWRVVYVYDSTDKIKLEPLEGTTEFIRFWPDLTEDGTPLNYRLRNNTLEVYPLPTQNTTFQVEYYAPPADLSADSDVPVFPEQFHDILVTGALADAYQDDGNLNQAKTYEGFFDAILKEMVASLLETRTERYSEITDNFF